MIYYEYCSFLELKTVNIIVLFQALQVSINLLLYEYVQFDPQPDYNTEYYCEYNHCEGAFYRSTWTL